MRHELQRALRMALVTLVLTGVIYPLAVTGLAQLVFPSRADGSLVRVGSEVVGSELIGQSFSEPGYFRGRPSYAGDGYDASRSGGSNLGPTSATLRDAVASRVRETRALEGIVADEPVPVDLVTGSASGLDPHISVAAAQLQVERVARERGMSSAEVRELVALHTQPRQLGFLGEPRVNVLALNMALDETQR